MSRSTITRALLAAGAALGFAALTAVPSAAAPDHPTSGDDHRVISMPNAYGSKFYENAVTVGEPDYVAFVGAALEDYYPVYCPERIDEPSTAFGTLRVKTDGPLQAPGTTDRAWVNATRVPVEVYVYDGGDAYQFLNAVCDGAVEPELYAEGSGVLWMRATTEYAMDPTGGTYGDRHEENGVKASLTTVDGEHIQVRGYADLTYMVVDIGTPDERPVFSGPPTTVTLNIW